MIPLVGFLTTSLGRYAIVGLSIVALISAFFIRHDHKVVAKVTQKIEANNVAVTKKADSAARKSLDPKSSGLLNPNYRAD
jgi:hypothetical protein